MRPHAPGRLVGSPRVAGTETPRNTPGPSRQSGTARDPKPQATGSDCTEDSQGPMPELSHDLVLAVAHVTRVRLSAGVRSLESRIALADGGGRAHRGRRSPRMAWPRSVRSADPGVPLSVALIDPAPDSVLAAPPPSLLLEFNRPILPDTVDNDVVIAPDRSRASTRCRYPAPAEPHPRRLGDSTIVALSPGGTEPRDITRC